MVKKKLSPRVKQKLVNQINVFKKSNGYVIESKQIEDGLVYQIDSASEETEYDSFVRIMHELHDIFSPQESNSRYAKKRLYLITMSGDKYQPTEVDEKYIHDLKEMVELIQNRISILERKNED